MLSVQAWLQILSAPNIAVASKNGIAKGLNGTLIYSFLFRFRLLLPISLLVGIVALYFMYIGNKIFSILIVIVGIYIIVGYLFQSSFQEFLIAKKRFKEWSLWETLLSSISLIIATAVAYVTKNILYYAVSQMGIVIVISLTRWIHLIIKEDIVGSYKRSEIDKECIHYGLKLLPFDILSVTAIRISHIFIASFMGFGELAVFSVANTLQSKSASLFKAINPLLYADFANKDFHQIKIASKQHFMKLTCISTLLTILIVIGGIIYIRVWLPPSFQKSMIYFLILCLNFPTSIIGMILATMLQSHLIYKEQIAIGIAYNIIRIILIIIFGYFANTIGICIAITLSYYIQYIFYHVLIFHKNMIKNISNKILPKFEEASGENDES